MAEAKECSGLDDPRYRITMGQQMAASCTGALITSFIAVELNTAGALANYATEADLETVIDVKICFTAFILSRDNYYHPL
uniref:Uncharacterized protein n=1 Tax=Timema douglasi TaxID=61478 RepID=A0A7R8VPB7_TIMDO|nr:unnamed protein product [Timema douglasi]